MKESSCKGIFGTMFGHKFRARYSTTKSASKPGSVDGSNFIMSTDMPQIIESTREVTSTYEHDVCVRCGEVR